MTDGQKDDVTFFFFFFFKITAFSDGSKNCKISFLAAEEVLI